MRVYTFKGKAVPSDPVKESVSREEDRTPDTACDPLLQLSSHFPEEGLRRVFQSAAETSAMSFSRLTFSSSATLLNTGRKLE